MHRSKHIVIEKTNSSSVFFSQVFINLQPQIAKPLYDCAFKIFHVDDQWSIDKFIYLSHRLAPNFLQPAQSYSQCVHINFWIAEELNFGNLQLLVQSARDRLHFRVTWYVEATNEDANKQQSPDESSQKRITKTWTCGAPNIINTSLSKFLTTRPLKNLPAAYSSYFSEI